MIDALKLAAALRMMADGLELASKAFEEDNVSEIRKETKAEKKVEAKSTKKAKEPDPEEEDVAEEEVKAEKKAETKSKKDESGEVKLSDLQDQAAILLAGGHRRTLKSILDEVGVKSLSTAEPSTYEDLKEKLAEAIEGMDLT